jgi:stage III sporulation protein SpoIIIAA
MKHPKRLCIFPKDIQLITGRSARYGRNMINEIKIKLNKQPHQYVTIQEFAEYSGLTSDEILKYITD